VNLADLYAEVRTPLDVARVDLALGQAALTLGLISTAELSHLEERVRALEARPAPARLVVTPLPPVPPAPKHPRRLGRRERKARNAR